MNTNSDKRKLSQGYVDLQKKTEMELRELLDRQVALLQNKAFIQKLPDKGHKIISFKSLVEEELKKRDSVCVASDLLSRISLNGNIEDVEWASGSNTDQLKKERDSDDDSDDSVDPLKLLATHCGTQRSKIKKDQRAEPSLVTQKDIDEVKTFSSAPYADEFCKRIDKLDEPPERFKPNQPKSKEGLKSAFRSSSENVQKKMGKHWEVTAATPPIPLHGDTKKISLSDSIALQREQAEKLKEIQFKGAIAKLEQTSGLKMGPLPTRNLMKYRNPTNPVSIFEGTAVRENVEEEPILDEDERDGLNAVFYNIVDDVDDKP